MVTRNRLASFNTSDGSITSFDPNVNNQVSFLGFFNNKLTAGGSFTSIGGFDDFQRFAQFSDITNPNTTIVSYPSNPSFVNYASFSFLGSDNMTIESEITFECKLNNGVWSECEKDHELNNLLNGEYVLEVKSIDLSGNVDNTPALYSWSVETPPVLTEITPIGNTHNKNPVYTFHSSSEGVLTYGGTCNSSYTEAVFGNNTIQLDELEYGNYYDCTISLVDDYGIESNLLNITSFNIVNANSGGGSYLSPTMLKNLNVSVDPKYSPWLQANSPNTSSVVLDTISASTFPRLLRTGMIGQDVKELQKLLNQKGFTVSQTGAGSVGNETTFFGVKTRDALVRFQRANTPLSVDGLFGPKSRDVLIK